MATDHTPISGREQRLLEFSLAYDAVLESGSIPDREAFAQRFPDLADEMPEAIEGIELARSLDARGASWTEPPRALGDYRILREIGRGGMGAVYEAEHVSTKKRLAIKTLPSWAGRDERRRARFLNEALATSQLQHDHIVPVLDAGCENGVYFYAMPLIEGESLAELNDAAPGPRLGELKQWALRFADVADALDYAHDAGVVHRDVKPGNLLLDRTGKLWVADFGLARVAAESGVTETGDVLGTVRYISPEQLSGRRAVVDGRSDVYSLGATMYEVLCRRPMFDGGDRRVLIKQVVDDDPAPIREHVADFPMALETIVLKCLAKSPSDRYESAAALSMDLRRFASDAPIAARRRSLADRALDRVRRRPEVFGATVLALALGAIGLAISTALVSRAHQRTREALTRESLRAAEAQAQFQISRDAVDEMVDVADDELAALPFHEGPRQRLLESALRCYQDLIESHDESPAAQLELNAAKARAERILRNLAIVKIGRSYRLLREPDVLDDMQVTSAQREQIAALRGRRPPFPVPPEGMRAEDVDAALAASARASEEKLSQVLTESQILRLRQIAWQWQGPMALMDADVAEKLSVTREQRQTLRAALQRQMTIVMERAKGQLGMAPPQTEDLDTALSAVLAVLTVEQRSRWDELIGPKYRGKIATPGPGTSIGPVGP